MNGKKNNTKEAVGKDKALPKSNETLPATNGSPQRKKQKARISREKFDRKVAIWTVVVSLITGLSSSGTTLLAVHLTNTAKVEYRMSSEDQLEVNKLAAQIDVLARRYFEAKDPLEREKLNAELQVLAKHEASIMRKYNPNYQSRWPLAYAQKLQLSPWLAILALLFGSLVLSFYLTRWRLGLKYEIVSEAGE